MLPLTQEVENFQTQPHCPENVDVFCNGNEQERELEESLSLSDLPLDKINIGNQEGNVSEEESNQNAGEFSENDFDFGSFVGSIGTLDGEMCAADEVFSGGQMLPYRNSVSSISGLRTLSRSDSDGRGFESRSNSSRSSSIRSHYSATSSGSSSSGSVKTVPLVSKSKIRNQFHSYPSPKPQVLSPGTRSATCTTPPGRKSKMWEVLRLGLVRTPEIELHDLKQRHRIANNHGKIITTIPRNNSIGSSSTTISGIKINDDRARNSFAIDGNKIIDFMSEIQKRKNQLPENKSNNGNGNGNGNGSNNSGFFKSCKCSVGAIEPIQTIRSNSGLKNGEIGSGNNKKIVKSSQNILAANEDKNLGQKKIQVVEEQKHHQKQSRNNNHLRQGKQNLSHHHQHHHHHHHRTFEWLKNLSHASVLNS